MALLGLKLFLKPTTVYDGVLLGGLRLLPPPKKTPPRNGFQCFSNGFHFVMVFTLIFLFFFTPSAKRGDAADMLVSPYYSDVSNANLDCF